MNKLFESIDNLFESGKDIIIEASRVNPAKAFTEIFNNYYDGMGDYSDTYDFASYLADECGVNLDDYETDSFSDLSSVVGKLVSKVYKENPSLFKEISDSLIENIDGEYFADTLEGRQGSNLIGCFQSIKSYVSDTNKVDEIIAQLQSVNVDIRLVAEEFQRYFHDNYKPWEFLGTTTGPRTYVKLFDCPTDYEIVGSDYFNYAGRPSNMLDNIGYGWKQTDDGVQADLIGFKSNVEGSSVVYNEPPVTYGYSAVIASSNKEEKFKEMADALASKAKEIKAKYKLDK